jgi:DNA primase
MPHPAASVLPLAAAAVALGMEVVGNRARCFNAQGHQHGVDRNPSLHFWSDTNRFMCFACGVAGDVIDLVRAVRQTDFRSAVEWITAQATCRLPVQTAMVRGRVVPDAAAREVYEALFELTFPIDERMPAGRYLISRGIVPTVASAAGSRQVGDPGELWAALVTRFGEDRLRTAGLVSRRNRFLFGGHSLLFFYMDGGQPVYVQARDITGQATAKELSLAGLGSPVPYNADQLRHPLDRVVVCEGCIDTLSAIQLGYSAVGVPGVAGFRTDWYDRFRNVGTVVLLFDNDDAGLRAAAELRAQFRLRGIRADAVHPVRENDVNDVLKKITGGSDDGAE